MGKQYEDWIRENTLGLVSILGKCAELSHAMKKTFPELRLTNGEIKILADKNKRLHWWLVDKDGAIVDPTSDQFNGGIEEYFEATPESDCRNYTRARCPNCGDAFYITPDQKHSPLCSEKCETEYAAYLTAP